MATNTIDYTIQPGDTLRSVAKKLYGDENQYSLLQNVGTDFAPGNTIKAPTQQQQTPAMTPNPRDAQTGPAAMTPNPRDTQVNPGGTPPPSFGDQLARTPNPTQAPIATTPPTAPLVPATTPTMGNLGPAQPQQQMAGGDQSFKILDGLKNGTIDPNQTPVSPAEKEGFAMFANYQKYQAMDGKQLYDAMQRGELTPDPNNVLWRAISNNGQATKAMTEAYAMWDMQRKSGMPMKPGEYPYLGGQFPKPTSTDDADTILNNMQNSAANGGQMDISAYLNQNQNADGSSLFSSYESQINAMITGAKAPTTPNYYDTLTGLRSQYGVPTLESDLNDLNKQYEDLQAELRQRTNYAEGQKVPMGVIAGRVGEVERQQNERLDAVRRQIQTKTDQLNMANTNISNFMKTKQLDYETASAAYEKQMSAATNMLEQFRGMRKDELDAKQKDADNARANLNVLYNQITEGGLDVKNLSPMEAAKFAQMELKSGYPVGTFLSLNSKYPQEELKTTKELYDANGNLYLQHVMQNRTTGEISLVKQYVGNDASKALGILKQAQDLTSGQIGIEDQKLGLLERGVDIQQKQQNLQAGVYDIELKKLGITKAQMENVLKQAEVNNIPVDTAMKQANLLDKNLSNTDKYDQLYTTEPGQGFGGLAAKVSGTFGQQYGAGVEATKNGKNVGTDFAVPAGTPVILPQGDWKVIDVKSGVTGGNLTDYKNAPYGNSVLVQNTQTGEKLRFSHLSATNVQNGATISGGALVGKSGATGNVTGAHLDLEYYDGSGKMGDVLKSDYGSFYTGGTRKKTTAEKAASKDTAASQKQATVSKITAAFSDPNSPFHMGADGKVSEESYDALKRQWTAQGMSGSEFDDLFKDYVNPLYYTSYNLDKPDAAYFASRQAAYSKAQGKK